MTIEGPMFPPRAESAAIIDFQAIRAAACTRAPIQEANDEPAPRCKRPLPEQLTETAKNERLRRERNDAWNDGERIVRYWRTRLDFEDAVQSVQRAGLPEGKSHPTVDYGYRGPMVEKWRTVLVHQLMMPAQNQRAINWKKTTLASGQHRHVGVKDEQVERAIAKDDAFLVAHPVRQSKNKPVQQ